MTQQIGPSPQAQQCLQHLHPRPHHPFSGVMVVAAVAPIGGNPQLLRFYDNLICVIFLIDFFLNLRGRTQEIGLLYRSAGLARPARLDPLVRGTDEFGVRPLAAGSLEPAGAHYSSAARRAEEGAGQGRPRSPQPVRGVYYHLSDDPGSDRCQRAGAPIREPIAGCEHHHGWGRAVVCDRHHHHRGVWRLLPCDRRRDELPPCSSCSRASASSAAWPAFSPACWLADRLLRKRRRRRSYRLQRPLPQLRPPSVEDELKAVREELAVVRQMLEKMGAGERTNQALR